MPKDFYFKFFFKDWLVSTQGMDASARGWYINLLCQQADKHRLPNDIELLADLAGVKFSEFQQFKEVFKRTLKLKFKLNENQEYYNERLDEVMQARKESSVNQSKRATIGVFIKNKRKKHPFTSEQWSAISGDLMKVDFTNKTKKEITKCLSVRFNRMVEAVINNSNYNYNINSKEKGVVGEKTAYEVLNENSPSWIEQFEMKAKSQIPDYDVFKTNFEFAVAKDSIDFDDEKLLKLRLQKQFANWDKAPKNGKKVLTTLSNER